MGEGPSASVVIDNFNYGRFLGAAIDSALAQRYRSLEVIVVDDGSTDDSRAVIAAYGDRIRPVLKPNGGMGSALNAGFAAARGEVIVFLDADDLLLPDAVGGVIAALSNPSVGKAHWPMWEIDERGARTGRVVPDFPLATGNERDTTVTAGPFSSTSAPTSGNAWSRRLLERVMPIPESRFRQHADAYLFVLAPAYAELERIDEPLSCYRVHGHNDYATRGREEQIRRNLALFDPLSEQLALHLRAQGERVDPRAWKTRNPYYRWMQDFDLAVREMERFVPPSATVILVDGDEWGAGRSLSGRLIRPFLERDGQYWGPPPDDDSAVRELERLRLEGASHIVFAWPAFWWLDHYQGFRRYLEARYPRVLVNDRLIAFDLRAPDEQEVQHGVRFRSS